MFERSDDKTILNLIVRNCPVFYFSKHEKHFPIDVEQYLRKSQLRHLHNPSEVHCSSIQNLFLEKRYLINGRTRSPLSDKDFFLNPSSKIQTINTLSKSTLYARLTLNDKYIRIVYYMFFPENEGQVVDDEYIEKHQGDWKHCALYFDKVTFQLSYLVLAKHGKDNEIITSDAINYEIVSGNSRPILYIEDGTHSIITNMTTDTKRWCPKNIVFLPENLQRARRNKSCWIFYRGQYSPDKIYGPIHYKWWNYDPEFLEHIADAQEEFKTRQKRLEDISEVIDETKRRVKSRGQSRPHTEVNRKLLRESSIPTPSNQADKLIERHRKVEQLKETLDKQKYELSQEEQQLVQLRADLERQQEELAYEKKEFKTQQTKLYEEKQELQVKCEMLKNDKQQSRQETDDIQQLKTTIQQYQLREKSLLQKEAILEKEKASITKMIQDNLEQNQEKAKQEHEKNSALLHDVKVQITQRSRELRELEKQLEQMTQQLEEKEKDIQSREEEVSDIIAHIEEKEHELQQREQSLETNTSGEKILKLKQTIENLENENVLMKGRVEYHQEEETRLYQQLNDIQEEMKTIQEHSSDSLETIKQEYTAEIKKLNEIIQTREDYIQSLKTENAKYQKENSNYIERETKLQNEITTLRQELKDQLERIERIQQELKYSKKVYEGIESEMVNEHADLTLENRIAKSIQTRDEHIEELNLKIQTLEQTIENAHTTQEESDQQLKKARKQMEQAHEQYEQEIREHNQKEQEWTELIQQFESQMNEYKQSNKQLTHTNEKQLQQIRDIQKKVNILSNEYKTVKHQLNLKNKEINSHKNKVQTIEKKHNEFKAKTDYTIRNLQEQTDEQTQVIQQHQNLIESKTREMREKEKEIEEYKTKLLKLSERVSKDKHQNLQNEYKIINEKYIQIKNEYSSLRAEINEKEQSQQQIREEYDKLKQNTDRIESENKELKQQIESKKNANNPNKQVPHTKPQALLFTQPHKTRLNKPRQRRRVRG